MATTNLPTKLVLVLMCVLSLAGCSALRHRHRETITLGTLQTKKESHSERHYEQTKQTCDTLARLQCQQQSDERHAEAGLISTPPTQKGHPLPWILSGAVITLGLCLLLWRRLRKR